MGAIKLRLVQNQKDGRPSEKSELSQNFYSLFFKKKKKFSFDSLLICSGTIK